MVYAEKGNKVLEIDEGDAQKYAEKGFTIKDIATGRVIQETIPTDIGSLRIAYKEHIDKIKALEAEIADLKAELAKKPVKATTSKLLDEVEAEKKAEEPKEEPFEDKPKRGRKKAD